MKHYNIPIFIPHLGCPYDCIYCNQRTIAAQQEIPGPAQVIYTIEQHLQTIPGEAHVEVAFFGGSFTAVDQQLQEDYLRAVQPFLQQGRVQSVRVSTRPDCIDGAALDLLAAYGVKTIELGVQSLSERVLQAAVRKYSPELVCQSSRLIQSRQFELGIQLMIGLPQDSYAQDMDTTRQVIAIRPQSVRIYPTLVIAGTALEAMWGQGDYIPLRLDEAVATCRDMLLLLQRENIRVIRMGLYPGEELCRDGVVKAGPFHPSFGELVEQEIFKAQARMAIRKYGDAFSPSTEIELHVNFRDISKMTGQHKKNLHELSQEFGLSSIQVKAEPGLERDWVGICPSGTDAIELIISRAEFIGCRGPV
jgi:histone acetyltransferase (RNA polymerase elongator complex component)